jgi:alpha-1,2-mannosyltransferase
VDSEQRSRATRFAWRVAAFCVVAATGWVLVAFVVESPWHRYFDLDIYRSAVIWWQQGRPLYSFPRPHAGFGFTYPPFAALLMSPLGAVSLRVAATVHTIACVVVLAVSTWWLVTPVARRVGWVPWFAVGLTLPVVMGSDPVREAMGWGQVGIFLAVLVLADLVGLRNGRRWAGVGIGLATAVKVTPGLFVVYLVLTRRWRAAAVASGTFVVTTGLTAVVAPRASWEYWVHALWETSRVGDPVAPGNQSLLGVLDRLLRPAQPSALLWALLVAGVVAVSLGRAVRASRHGDELVGFTLVGLAGCLVSPIAWSHHLYWVVPAGVVLLDVAAGARLSTAAPAMLRRRQRAVRRAAMAGLGLLVAVFWINPTWIAKAACGGLCSTFPGVIAQDAFALSLLALVVLLPIRETAPEASDQLSVPRPQAMPPGPGTDRLRAGRA